MRNGLIVGTAVALAGLLGPAATTGPTATASLPVADGLAPATSPNVVLVVMDDMRADDLPWMPTVTSEIAETGTQFTRFYAPTPLCCPSRASLLRGQYPHNSGILTNAEPDGGFAGFSPLEDSTLATWLDPTYTTGYVGKYLNGYEGSTQTHVPPGWDFWNGTTRTYHYKAVLTNENGTVVDHSGVNSPDLFGEQAIQFLDTVVANPEPFFLELSFVTPHNGRPHTDGDSGWLSPWVRPRDRDTYTGPVHPEGPAYDELDMSDKTGPGADLPPLTEKDEAQIAVRNQQRRESLASADRAVRRVLAALDEHSRSSNTYVIFTSDNGQFLGEHRISLGKSQPYEPAARVPLLIAGPGVPAGNTWTAPAGMHDLAPTILEMAGVPTEGLDAELDGQSVLPTVERPEGDLNRAVLLEQADLPIDPEDGGQVRYAAPRSVRQTDWVYHAAVTDRWKLIEWDQLGTYELYDLRADPDEVDNLAYHPRYRSQQQRMVEQLERLRWCRASDCG
ncbi:MAG: sulfatase [Actinomycetota bacterium]|nr:sulfatase [Actinomycetota bacterium]